MKFLIYVCDGPSCGVTHDSDRLVEHIEAHKPGGVEVERFTCFDHCDDGPNLFVQTLEDGETPEDPDSDLFTSQRGFYDHMSEEKLKRVLEQHCKTGQPVDDLVTDY